MFDLITYICTILPINIYSLQVGKRSCLGHRHGLQKQLWSLYFCYKKFIKYSQYILLRNYISRWIYLFCFHIFKLNPNKVIYSQSLKCLTSNKLKTTSFTNTEGVLISILERNLLRVYTTNLSSYSSPFPFLLRGTTWFVGRQAFKQTSEANNLYA